MPKRTQNPSEIDALRVRIEELTFEVARLTALLRQPTAVDVRPEEPRTWLVSRAQPPRDYRPLYGDRPDDVKGASAPLTFGD